LTQPFEQHVLGELKPNKPCTHLSDLKRVGTLLKMLEWSVPGQINTQTLPLDQFRRRPVLPDPTDSMFGTLTGNAEPTATPVLEQPETAEEASQQQKPHEPVVETTRETVTLLTDVKDSNAKVRTERGEEIPCTRLPDGIASAGASCRAKVTREGGQAVRAVFKKWL
jgi:hypothetical protein